MREGLIVRVTSNNGGTVEGRDCGDRDVGECDEIGVGCEVGTFVGKFVVVGREDGCRDGDDVGWNEG